MKKIIATILSVFMLVSLVSCGSGSSDNAVASVTADENGFYTFGEYKYVESSEKTDYVLITMSDGGKILIELYPDIAPITVENFKNLVYTNFYDGLTFHRVISGFMIQGGDPTGTGSGGSDTKIKGEFSANGVENNLSHKRGVISMARSSAYDSASSQFFIMHADATYLDGQYAAFGEVLAGMSTVDAIASVETDSNDKPTTTQRISTVRFVEIK